jgi:hypothetical protein
VKRATPWLLLRAAHVASILILHWDTVRMMMECSV